MKYKTLLFLIICVLACSFSSCRSVQLRDKHKTEKSDVVSKTEVQPWWNLYYR